MRWPGVQDGDLQTKWLQKGRRLLKNEAVYLFEAGLAKHQKIPMPFQGSDIVCR
jgi:hypothetical protein